MFFILAASKIDYRCSIFFFSFLIYTISKEKKSYDGEANDSPIPSVAKKIWDDSGAHSVEVNKRILNDLRKRYQSSIQRSSGQANQEEKP